MMEFEVPSKSLSSIGGIEDVGRSYCSVNTESTKQCVDPESTRAEKVKEESAEHRGMRREFGSERADALRRITSGVAQGESTQSSTCAEV